MLCNVCGNEIIDSVKFCTSCGSPVAANENAVTAAPVQPAAAHQPAAPDRGYNADLAAAGAELFNYCKVELDPKYSKGGMIAFIVIAAVLILLGAVSGAFQIAICGLIVGGIGLLAIWGGYKINLRNAARLRSIMTNDGEETVLREFASSAEMAKDQFRMSAQYVFVKKKSVFRIINITKVTRVTESTNFIPTGVRLDVIVEDETGQTNETICRLHIGKSKNEADEIYRQILARQEALRQQYLAAKQASSQQTIEG